MSDFFSRMNGNEIQSLVAIVGGLLLAIIAVASSFWYRLRKAEIAALLKQDMLNRGMSAEDIRIVLEADIKK